MPKFPIDAPKRRVVRAFEILGFRVVREAEHVAMSREEPNGTRTSLTMPGHRHIKASTLRAVCTQAGVSRGDFLAAYERA